MNNIHVLLLRGVNVGGANRLPMPELRQYLSEIGLAHVQTHVQSGNVVFKGSTTGLNDKITEGMLLRFGFAPRLFFFDLDAYLAILKANPFASYGAANGALVHIFFLGSPFANADIAELTALAARDEQLRVTDKAAYLYAPSGIGRSKLAEKLSQTRKVDVTARNYTSAYATAQLAQTIPA
jgi:uncharacterized protein (DUF1697 family)